MKRIRALVIILAWGLTLLCTNASAVYFWDGHRLKEWSDAGDRISRNAPMDSDFTSFGALMGYVVGVSDMLDGSIVCLPGGASVGQITAVVQKYLRANPEKWNEPAGNLVGEALKQAFPCR